MEEETKQPSGGGIINLVMRHNVFYLLSALLMIIGCYLALQPFQQFSRSITDLIVRFALINFYEAFLIVTALYIIIKKNVIRDGTILLLIEGFFLADATLMNSVYYLQNIWVGIIINTVSVGLAFLKIYIIIRYLNLSFSKAFYRFISLGLIYLYFFPAPIFYGLKQGFDSAVMLFIIWSAAGLIPATLIGISRKVSKPSEFSEKAQIVFSLILLCLLLIHLSSSTWMFSATFYLCYLATFLITFAVILPELKSRWKEERLFHWLQYALSAGAILITLDFPNDFIFKASKFFPITISPLRLSLTLTALSFAYFYIVYRKRLFIAYGLLLLLSSFMGYEIDMIATNFADIAKWVHKQLPKTSKDWGIISIISSLVLFICGFLVSLKKSKFISLTKNQNSSGS